MPKLPQVLEELADVHSCHTQDGIVHVSFFTPEAIAFKSVFGFEVSYTWLNGGSPFHPFPESLGCFPSGFLVDMNLSFFLKIALSFAFAPVALIGKDMIG